MFERAGRFVVTELASAGDVSLFAFKALRELFLPPFEFRETIRQLFELGFRSAPLIAVSGVAVGVVLSMHTRASLERFGAESMIPAGLAGIRPAVGGAAAVGSNRRRHRRRARGDAGHRAD